MKAGVLRWGRVAIGPVYALRIGDPGLLCVYL